MKIAVWHNLRWSAYKAAVFTRLGILSQQRGHDLFVHHICETDSTRQALSPVDPALHAYPHEVLFRSSRSQVRLPALLARILRRTLAERADVTIVPGIDRPEYWLQAAVLFVLRRRRAVFCDSTEFDHRRSWFKWLGKRLFFTLVPTTLSYGVRARSYVIDHGVSPGRALLRCQAAYLPETYDDSAIPGLRSAQAPPPQAPVFLYVGRFSEEKALPDLLQAFDRIAVQFPDARLRLVGGGPDEAQLKAMSARLGLAARIEFTGPKSGDALYAEYLGASALVLPSQSEPWGLVVNEALHFGCPVVVSDRSGCVPELVEGSDCGFVFACGDVAALAAALAQAAALGADPGASAVAQRCLARIADNTPQHAAAQILDAIEQIAAA